jgi:hypothetical protein
MTLKLVLTDTTLMYKMRCLKGTKAKLITWAAGHNFHPVATVRKSFSCSIPNMYLQTLEDLKLSCALLRKIMGRAATAAER